MVKKALILFRKRARAFSEKGACFPKKACTLFGAGIQVMYAHCFFTV